MAKRVIDRVALLERYLRVHQRTLFKRQHRDGKNKRTFSLGGSFKVGTGSTQVGNLQHLHRPGFVQHNFKNTAAYVTPVSEQRGPTLEQKSAYRKAMRMLRAIDPDYAAGETVVQFAHMNTAEHYVARHVDREDISYQYAISLGVYRGAALRTYDSAGQAYDIDNHHQLARFDGRLPHEVVVDSDFEGDRYTVIFYKNYDHRKVAPDAVVETPSIVWP